MPITEANKQRICNLHFTSPGTSPFTGNTISLKSQQKLVKQCRVPLSESRVYISPDEQRRQEIISRIQAAGGKIEHDVQNATHIVQSRADSKVQTTHQYVMSMNTFIKLYFRSLYTECERFKADETHSPRTFRRIKPDKATHSKWVHECDGAKTAPQITVEAAAAEAGIAMKTSKVSESKKQRLLLKVQKMCVNDIEPVLLEEFANFSIDDLKKVVAIGDVKKHCLHASSAFNIYQKALANNNNARDPLNPDHVFTKEEVHRILRILKKPHKKSIQHIHGYQVRLVPEVHQAMSLVRISITADGSKNGEYEVYSLGYLPLKDNLTSEITQLIIQLLKKGKIITQKGKIHQELLGLRKSPRFWSKVTNKSVELENYQKSLQQLDTPELFEQS